MNTETITFTRLTVGDAEPVAEGSIRTGPDAEPLHFTLCWDNCPVLRAEFPAELYQLLRPTQREINELETVILREYRHIMCRALYGGQWPAPRTTLSANLKALRLGHAFARETAARGLDVRGATVSDMENGSFDFEADLWKYLNPSDSLLFRAAALYHVPQTAVCELSSPHFFSRNWIKGCSYDFGSKPFCAKLFPFQRPGAENRHSVHMETKAAKKELSPFAHQFCAKMD